MTKESSKEFRLKNIHETRNVYFIEEIDQNELMNKKGKKVCRVLNYIEHFPILKIGLKICVITSGINKYKSVIKKEKKRK